MDYLRQDIRYAFRRLFKAPGFALIAILTLALGIGANSAIFSVVNGVLLKPLPYPEAKRLVGVYQVSEGHRAVMSGPNFSDIVAGASSLENAASISTGDAILTGQGESVRLDVAAVSASLFNVLRVRPALGRVFNADENTPGKTNVVVLSDVQSGAREQHHRERHFDNDEHAANARAASAGDRAAAALLQRSRQRPARRMLMRSFLRLQSVDPGFDPSKTLSFELSLPDVRYGKEPQQIAFYDQLLPRLRALPGVRAADAAMALPLSGTNFNISFSVVGRPPLSLAQQPAMEVRVATPVTSPPSAFR